MVKALYYIALYSRLYWIFSLIWSLLLSQEVMAEVDDDQSSTLDFYEFVKVAVIILKKTGIR